MIHFRSLSLHAKAPSSILVCHLLGSPHRLVSSGPAGRASHRLIPLAGSHEIYEGVSPSEPADARRDAAALAFTKYSRREEEWSRVTAGSLDFDIERTNLE